MSTEPTTPQLSPEQQRHRDWNTWLTDFGNRFPAVRNYARAQMAHGQTEAEGKALKASLINSWEETLQGFAIPTLQEVTRAVIDGRLTPVENEQLGQFAEEIRKRARTVREWERKAEQRHQRDTAPPSPSKLFDEDSSMGLAIRCTNVVTERLADQPEALSQRIPGRDLAPEVYADHAVIVLAMRHTLQEEMVAKDTLRRYGLNWEEIRAAAQHRSVDPLLQSPGGDT